VVHEDLPSGEKTALKEEKIGYANSGIAGMMKRSGAAAQGA
jgi:hypothetical protein